MSAVELVLRLKDQAKERVYNCCQTLPEDMANVFKQLWADLEIRLADMLQDPVFCNLIATVGSIGENSAVLFTALAHVNERLCAVESATSHLRIQLADPKMVCSAQDAELTTMKLRIEECKTAMSELEAQLAKHKSRAQHYEQQTAELMLRQASFMVVNKLVRLFHTNKDGTSPTPRQAARYNLNNLRKSKQTDKTKLEAYLSSKPDLETGLQLLASKYSVTAHPDGFPPGFEDVVGSAVINLPYLQKCLDAANLSGAFSGAEAVRLVLEVLQELSDLLREPLFVPTAAHKDRA